LYVKACVVSADLRVFIRRNTASKARVHRETERAYKTFSKFVELDFVYDYKLHVHHCIIIIYSAKEYM